MFNVASEIDRLDEGRSLGPRLIYFVQVDFENADAVRLTSGFLGAPDRYLRRLFDEPPAL